MPTYHYYCKECGDHQLLWQSIHAEAIELGDCGHGVVRMIDNVVTMHIGKSGQEAVVADAREARWNKDMPAYKRMRREGLQPPGIDGCDHLEATAKSDLWVRSGGKIKVSDQRARESMAQAEAITKGEL